MTIPSSYLISNPWLCEDNTLLVKYRGDKGEFVAELL
jgi:hypothetical protein